MRKLTPTELALAINYNEELATRMLELLDSVTFHASDEYGSFHCHFCGKIEHYDPAKGILVSYHNPSCPYEKVMEILRKID